MQNFGNRRSVQKGAQNAGSNVLNSIMIAWVTINRKVYKKPNSIEGKTSETQFSFSDNQQ